MLERHYRELFNFLTRWTNDREAAADLVQESFARVLAVQYSGQTIADARALLFVHLCFAV
ncbi:MAG: sigma factor [Thiotrichales bacterium]